jgi:hypothetical protein
MEPHTEIITAILILPRYQDQWQKAYIHQYRSLLVARISVLSQFLLQAIGHQICCSIHKASLDEYVAYKTFSYVWGNGTDRQVIELNGQDVEVTRNLHNALIRIRDETETCVFWIDAVCIDQSNPAEKANQVPLMGDIYRLAEEVWCWLGLAQNCDDEIIAGLDTARLLKTSETLEEARAPIYDFIRGCLSQRGIEALIYMYEAQYWKRTWIIQEISLAREIRVMWGEYCVRSDILLSIYRFDSTIMTAPRLTIPNFGRLEKYGIGSATFMHVISTRNLVQRELDRVKPLKFLDGQRHLEVSDSRDKTYGFLGLLKDKLPIPVIDYTQNVEKIFTDFARCQIEASRSLEVIRFAGFERSFNKSLHLPSWVPDWDESLKPVNDRSAKSMEPHLYSSTKGRPSSASFRGNALFVDGIECYRVSLICQKMILFTAEDLLFREKPFTYPTGISRLQALFRVLIMDKYQFSDYRLSEDPEPWELRLVIGFFVYLGWSASEKIDEGDWSVCDRDEIKDILNSPPVFERRSDGVTVVVSAGLEGGLRGHKFIRALRNWYQGFIFIVGQLPEASGRQQVAKNGGVRNEATFPRRQEIDKPCFEERFRCLGEDDTSFQAPNLGYSRESLQKWKDCIETALCGETFDTILEPFLHHEAEAQSIQWPEHAPPGHESKAYNTRGLLRHNIKCIIRFIVRLCDLKE